MDAKQFQEELNSFMKETIFPASSLPARFSELVDKVMMKQSAHTHKLSVGAFKELLSVQDNQYNLTQTGYVLNVLIVQTMASLELSKEEYFEFMLGVEACIKQWNEIVGPRKQELQTAMQEAQMKEQKKNSIPFKPSNNNKRNGKKPPKQPFVQPVGEA